MSHILKPTNQGIGVKNTVINSEIYSFIATFIALNTQKFVKVEV